MAKSDFLFALIKSLTKSEKRYFKLVSGATGKQKNYQSLFETLEKQTSYNEQYIKMQFAGEAFIRQLHVAKNYLSNLILKSLRAYHLNHSVNAQLKSCLVDIEILFKRDLLTHSYRSVLKAEKLAQKIGDQRSLLEILNWKRKILLNMSTANHTREELNDIIYREQDILENLKNESQYWDLTVNLVNRGRPDIPVDHPLLHDPGNAKTHRSRVLLFHLLYITETMSGNLQKAEEHINQLVHYLEENQYYLRDDPGPYITALNNKIGLYLNQRRHHEVPEILNKIREIPEKAGFGNTSPISMKLLVRTYNVELETYRDSGQFSRGVDLIPHVRDFLTINKEYISDDYTILLHYQFAYLYFMEGALRKALRDINVVLTYRYRSGRADVVGYAQFLNMIIHYELGNYTVMKYAVDASRRFLKKRGNLMEFEKVLLRLFSRLSTQPDSNHSKIIMTAYYQLFGTPPLVEASQLDYLDFQHWMNSKIKSVKQ